MKPGPEARPPSKAWHHSAGKWTEGPDPVMDTWRERDFGGDEQALMRSLDYVQRFAVGDPYSSGFSAWSREESPRHVIVVGVDELSECLYVDALPDLLNLCARWTPVVRDMAIAEFLTDITRDERHLESWEAGVVESIARRAGWGARQDYRRPSGR